MQALYDELGERAAIFLVYVAEAHPEDEWQLDSNKDEGVIYSQPQSFDERVVIARDMLSGLKLSIPTLVDGIDDAAITAFAAWPERFFVADRDGRLVYCGEPGPFGFKPDEARAALVKLLSS